MFLSRSFGIIRTVMAATTILLAPAFARAQTNTGFIAGVVKDASGGVLPGASVKIVNEASSGTDLIAQQDGSFRSEPVVVGTYRVSASLDGFETVERRVTVSAGQTQVADFTLGPA